MYEVKRSLLTVLILGTMLSVCQGQADIQERKAQLMEGVRLTQQATQLSKAGRYAEAIPLAKQALANLEKAVGPEHRLVVIALNSLGTLYKEQGDYARASQVYNRALTIRQKTLPPEHPDIGQSLNYLGMILKAEGDNAGALKLYSRALAIAEKAYGPDHPAVAGVLSNLASASHAEGQYARALPLAERALAISEKAFGPEHQHVAITLDNLGSLYKELGDDRAERHYQRALAIREKLLGSDHPELAGSLNNLAGLYYSRGDYGRAAPLYQRALAISEKAHGPEHPDVAATLSNLATLYRDQGNTSGAAELYVRALNIYAKLLGPDHPHVAAVLNSISTIISGGDLGSLQFYQRILTRREKALGPEHPSLVEPLNSVAKVYRLQGDYARAEPLYQRALTIMEKARGPEHLDVANALSHLAMLYAAQGNYAAAVPLYRRCLVIVEKKLAPDHPLVAGALSALAGLYVASGDYKQAIDLLNRANQVREKNTAAILDATPQQQKQSFLDSLVMETTITVSLHVNYLPQNVEAGRLAFTTILRDKGRALDAFTRQLDFLRRRATPEDRKLLDDLTAVHSRLANLQLGGAKLEPDARRSEVARLTAEQERLEDSISRRSSEFRAATQPVTLERVRGAIPADAALVELFVYSPFDAKAKGVQQRLGPPRYVAYVLRPSESEAQFVDLGEAIPIDTDATLFRNALKSPRTPERQVKELGRKLDVRLMQPIRKLLGNTKRLLLAPDGPLNLVPFEALVDESDRYLIESYSFNYITSGRDLMRMDVAESSTLGASAVVANPQFDLMKPVVDCRMDQRWLGSIKNLSDDKGQYHSTDFSLLCYSTLNGTAREAAGLEPLLRDVKLFTGQDATEAALKSLHRPRVLHIATHGFFLPDQPAPLSKQDLGGLLVESPIPPAPKGENPLLRSGLLLAGVNQGQSGPDNDGVLTALEVAGLDLFGTKLVVLSACETGLGEIKNGQGVYGLRRALVLAGSETQIMSLWKVSDDATRNLMVAYYKRLQNGEGRTEALRQVQLEMLRGQLSAAAETRQRETLDSNEIIARPNYRFPYFWAAFIASGDWRPMR